MFCSPLAVIPVIVGPLQVLIAVLPALLLSLAGSIVAMLKPSAMWAFAKLMWRQKMALAIVAAVAAGTVFGARAAASHFRPATARVAGADWPMFRGGPERRGSNDAAEPPAAGGIVWSYTADVRTFSASPAVVGNRVYVTSADKGPLRDRGAVYCLDADTGALVWKSAPRDYLATFSSPSIAGNYLVVGEGLHFTKTARVVCMDLSANGRILWTHQTRSHVESTPCIDKERVYVGAGDDGYYCFRLAPGADGEAQLVWHTPPERYPDAETSPAARNGRVFVGLGMGGNAIVCLNADTGDEIWRRETPYPVFGPPTAVDGSVVVGMGNGNFIESAEEVMRKEVDKMRKAGRSEEEIAAAARTMGPAGEVWCVAEDTGEPRWTYKAAEVILGAVVADNGNFYFGARDGYLYCLSRDGKLRGKWNANAPLLTSPAVSGGHVYVVTETGMLYGLRAGDLERVWEARLGFTGPFVSSPAVARGRVYVGSQQDGLLCLGVPRGRQPEIVWAGYAGGPGRGGNVDGRPLPEKGKFVWRFPETEGADEAPDLRVEAPPACLNGALYVPARGGRKGLLCLREESGGGKARGAEAWFAAAPNAVTLSPAATTGEVFFVDGARGDAGRALRCLDAADGREKWTLPVDAGAAGEFVLTAEGGLIADGPGRLTAFDAAGRVAWRTDCGDVRGMPCASEAFVVVAADRPCGLCVLDRPTGRVLWRRPLDEAPASGPLVRRNTIYAGTPRGIAALRLSDGAPVWEADAGAPGAPPALVRDRLAYTTADGALVVIALEDGRVERTVVDVVPGIPPLAAPESFVYAVGSGLMSCPAAAAGEPVSWARTDWLGRLTCAPVMADSRIYIATDTKGLVCLKSK